MSGSGGSAPRSPDALSAGIESGGGDAAARVLRGQAAFCRSGGSPFIARLCDAAADDVAAGGPIADLLAPWRGRDAEALVEDAVALRLAAAFNALRRDGSAPELAAAYPPVDTPADLGARLSAAASAHAERMGAFLRSPPQTNEVRRALALLPGLHEAARASGLPLSVFEIGASAGLLSMWDRFAYDAEDGSWSWGAADAPVRLVGEWRGPPPRLASPVVADRRACDAAPVDLADPEARRRLEAFVWPDQPDRMARLQAAADLVLSCGLEVERADAGEWLTAHLHPQPGVATVLMHSVMFQYLDAASRAAVLAAIARAASAATDDAPFAWLRFEPDPGELATRHMEVRLTQWPGGEERLLARSHPHGAWVEFLGAAAADTGG